MLGSEQVSKYECPVINYMDAGTPFYIDVHCHVLVFPDIWPENADSPHLKIGHTDNNNM
jgi:hypothetical protein